MLRVRTTPAIAHDRVERIDHALGANRFEMAAEHQGGARRPGPEHADDVRPTWRDLLHLDVETDPTKVSGDRRRNRPFTDCAGHEGRIGRID